MTLKTYPNTAEGMAKAEATPEPRSIWIDSLRIVVRTGEDYEAPPVPVVSMRAFRRALAQVGLRQAVEDYVAAAPVEVRDDWATAGTMHRDNELILAAADALKQDAAAMDALFALAQQIEATL